MLLGAAYNLTTFQMTAYGAGREQLARVGAHGIHFIAERLYAAVENVERKRSDFISLSDKTACLEYGIYCV